MAKIVFIGDSIIKGVGYGDVVEEYTFAKRIGTQNGYAYSDVINAGVSGDTSWGVRQRINSDCIAHAPDVCVLMIGANDWALGSSVANYKINMLAISEAVRGAGIKLVIITSNMQRGSCADILAQEQFVKASEEIPCDGRFDLFREMAMRGLINDHAQYYVDNIHLNLFGHSHITEMSSRPKHIGLWTK